MTDPRFAALSLKLRSKVLHHSAVVKAIAAAASDLETSLNHALCPKCEEQHSTGCSSSSSSSSDSNKLDLILTLLQSGNQEKSNMLAT